MYGEFASTGLPVVGSNGPLRWLIRLQLVAPRALQLLLAFAYRTPAVIFSTLMGEAVDARRKFIGDNALEVTNLDI